MAHNPATTGILSAPARGHNEAQPLVGSQPAAHYEKYGSMQHALAEQMTRVIALMALTVLGLSAGPVHEPVHARGHCARHPATVR